MTLTRSFSQTNILFEITCVSGKMMETFYKFSRYWFVDDFPSVDPEVKKYRHLLLFLTIILTIKYSWPSPELGTTTNQHCEPGSHPDESSLPPAPTSRRTCWPVAPKRVLGRCRLSLLDHLQVKSVRQQIRLVQRHWFHVLCLHWFPLTSLSGKVACPWGKARCPEPPSRNSPAFPCFAEIAKLPENVSSPRTIVRDVTSPSHSSTNPDWTVRILIKGKLARLSPIMSQNIPITQE